MSVITENNKDHLLNYEGVEQLLVKINDRFARTDRYATPDTLGMIRAEINTDVNSEDISTGDNHPVQITTDGNAFVNINVPTVDVSLDNYYTKSEVYNKSEVDDKIDNLPESLESKFIVNDAGDTSTVLINRRYEDDGSVDITVSDDVEARAGASIIVSDIDDIAHSGLTINNGYTKIVGETQTGSSETSGGSIILSNGSVKIEAWMEDTQEGNYYSNNLSLNGNGLLLNGSDVITTQNAYANGVLLVNSQNVSNHNELIVGGFEIKNVTPYSYTIEASLNPEDPDYFYDEFNSYNECIITAEWDKNEPVIIDRSMIIPNVFGDIYAYKFIITGARVYGEPIDASDSEYQWYDYQKPVDTEVFIPAGYLDEEYRDAEHNMHPIEFIDGQGSLPGSIYIDANNSGDELKHITVIQYAPMSLRHTSKALLNGVEVATVDQIPEIPESLPANGGNADTVDGKHASDVFVTDCHTSITNYGTTLPKYVDLSASTPGHADFISLNPGSYNIPKEGHTETLLHFKGSGSTSALEFLSNYRDSDRLKFRKIIDGTHVSGAWKDLAFTSDIPTTPAQIGAATADHTHNRFTSDLVHFDGAIHICNRSAYDTEYDEETGEEYETERITGIYFSDAVEDSLQDQAYTFIREEGDDRLRVHGNNELKLSTGGSAYSNSTDEINGPNIRIINSPDDDDYITEESIQLNANSGVFVNGNEVAVKSDIPTIPTSLPANGGNADTVDNKHASDFVLKSDANAGNWCTPIYISGGKSYTISTIEDTFIRWKHPDQANPGTNLQSLFSPIDTAASQLHSANRLAFGNPNGITVEYSTDGGATWIDYGLTDAQKINLISNKSYGTELRAGKALSTRATANDKLRITINASVVGFYTCARALYINFSTQGSDNCTLDVERAARGSETNFTTWKTSLILNGWSGWNKLPLGGISFGGGDHQTSNVGAIRLTISSSGANSSYTGSCHFSVYDLQLIGDTTWSTCSNMGKTGHLYDYDYNQNAIFPASVTATGFTKKDSSDSYVLLGGGGHKLISDFAVANHNHTISVTSTFIPNVTSSYNDGVLTILGATTNVQCTGTTDVENTNANPESWFVNPDDMTALF